MVQNEIYEALTEIFREVFQDPPGALRADMTAKDVRGWDSMRQINLILAVEQRFGIRLRAREVDQLGCVGDLVRSIEGKVGA